MTRLAALLLMLLSPAVAGAQLMAWVGVAPTIQATPAILVADEGAISFTPTLTAGSSVTFSASDLPTGGSINSSTGQITGTLSAVGIYPTLLAATNSPGTDYRFAPVVVYSSIISIGQAEVDAEYPYEMDTANAVYQLTENVTCDASVFTVQADGVTLDLAGYDLTYNNDAANTITNQDFDNWTGSEPDNWTVEDTTSHDKIAAASSNVLPVSLCEGTYALRAVLTQGTATAGTLTSGTPANIASVGHGLVNGDHVILAGYIGTQYGTSQNIDGGYTVTRVDDDNFTINADVSAVSDGAGTWIKACMIESASTSLPVNNRLYTALAGVAGTPGGTTNYTASVKVVNAADGMEMQRLVYLLSDQWGVYADTYSANEGRNGVPACTFLSASVANCKVRIYLSTTAASNTVDVFRVRLSQSYDNAIVHRGTSNSAFPQQYNYSTAGLTSTTYGPVAIVDSVGGGRIIQGQNRGFRSWPIVLRKSGSGVVIHGVELQTNHDDGAAILVDHSTLGQPGAVGQLVVADVTATQTSVNEVTRRDSQVPFLNAKLFEGNVTVADSTFTGSNVQTIGITTTGTVDILLDEVTIRPRGHATNNYAVNIGESNYTVRDCAVDAISGDYYGEGLYISPGLNNTIGDITLTGNTVNVRGIPNREYGTGNVTRPLRIRNATETGGILLDYTITGNTFYAECLAAGYLTTIQGARVSMRAETGMDTATYVISTNTFTEVCDQSTGSASAFEIDRWDDGVGELTAAGNTFNSNDTCVQLHGTDQGVQTISGLNFTGSTFTKNATANPGRAFSTFRFGYNGSSVTSDSSFLTNTFNTGTAYNDITNVGGTHTVTIDQ